MHPTTPATTSIHTPAVTPANILVSYLGKNQINYIKNEKKKTAILWPTAVWVLQVYTVQWVYSGVQRVYSASTADLLRSSCRPSSRKANISWESCCWKPLKRGVYFPIVHWQQYAVTDRLTARTSDKHTTGTGQPNMTGNSTQSQIHWQAYDRHWSA